MFYDERGRDNTRGIQSFAGGFAVEPIRVGWPVCVSHDKKYLRECKDSFDVPVGFAVDDYQEGDLVDVAHLGVTQTVSGLIQGQMVYLGDDGRPSSARGASGRVLGVCVQDNTYRSLIQLGLLGMIEKSGGGGGGGGGTNLYPFLPTTMDELFGLNNPKGGTSFFTTLNARFDNQVLEFPLLLEDRDVPDWWYDAADGESFTFTQTLSNCTLFPRYGGGFPPFEDIVGYVNIVSGDINPSVEIPNVTGTLSYTVTKVSISDVVSEDPPQSVDIKFLVTASFSARGDGEWPPMFHFGEMSTTISAEHLYSGGVFVSNQPFGVTVNMENFDSMYSNMPLGSSFSSSILIYGGSGITIRKSYGSSFDYSKFYSANLELRQFLQSTGDHELRLDRGTIMINGYRNNNGEIHVTWTYVAGAASSPWG